MIKIGIDLATTISGVFITKPQYQKSQLKHYGFVIDTTGLTELKDIYNVWNQKLSAALSYTDEPTLIGIELSNFGNPKNTQQFSLIVGMILPKLFTTFSNLKIKLFNSNEWQSKVGCAPQDQRPVRKQKAREFAKKVYPDLITDKTSQDIVDACCICHFLNELHTTQQQNEAVKAQKKQKEQTKSKKILLQQKIITLQSKISTLDAIKNKKRINTLTNQLNNLKEDLNNV